MALDDVVGGKKRASNQRVRRIRISPGAVFLTGAAIVGAVYLISQAVKADTAPSQNVPEQPPGQQEQIYTPPPAEPTATVVPTATAVPGIMSLEQMFIALRGDVRVNPPQLRAERTSLADTIESTLGLDGYDAAELNIISIMERVAGDRETIEDLKTILLTKSYRSKILNVGGRNIEVVVLSSDPNRAHLYFDMLERIIPRVESFTGLKHDNSSLVIYSTPKLSGDSLAFKSGIKTWYPEDPDKTVLRAYETTTQGKALEETVAHEFDHVVSSKLRMPIWLFEGKANFTAYHALRSKDGLPTIDGNFQGYLANVRRNVIATFGYSPPIGEHDGSFTDLRRIGGVTVLGELHLEDILVQIGPKNMALVIKDINSQAEQRLIDRQIFYGIVLAHTPEDMRSQMTKFLQERYEGLHPEGK